MDEQGRLRLSIVGPQRDIARHAGELRPGMEVILNVQDEFEVNAILVYDEESDHWKAWPDVDTIRFYEESS
jgi:hypothetical protein